MLSESVLTASKPTKICFEKTVKSAVDKTEILFFFPETEHWYSSQNLGAFSSVTG